ncbi:glycosyltransferase family 9 protein [Motilibacter sp. E257]|uniref:Glycosyltransferase family 9 protein n=1 Tax=Motilibacter deserti TaxID=2714956 RepID=A0ABX0GTN8_9ACTN|nr:glycosyltransferase family 9 protein [Motilibacter deserti]
MEPSAESAPPGTPRPSALVLRALGLGDLLTAVPALRGLRRALPGHRLVLATPDALAPVALLSGAVDATTDARGLDGPLAWDGPPPAVAVNLHGSGPQSHQLLASLRPGRLLAFANTAAGVEGPAWEPAEHERVRWCRLVASQLEPCEPDDLVLARPDAGSPAPGAVVVHPGAAYASRRWPVERFAEVAATLRAAGHRIVVTGSAGERGLAERLAAGAGLPADDVLAGSTSLLELAALVADAALVVSGDTGIAHLAFAYERPSVTVFGPAPPARWGPPPPGRHVVVWHGDPDDPWREGDVFGASPVPELLDVAVPEVLDAAKRALRA